MDPSTLTFSSSCAICASLAASSRRASSAFWLTMASRATIVAPMRAIILSISFSIARLQLCDTGAEVLDLLQQERDVFGVVDAPQIEFGVATDGLRECRRRVLREDAVTVP